MDRKGTEINAVQKQIGQKKKNKEDASELLAQKVALENEKKELEAKAVEKETFMTKRLGTIGNIVHESVPISDNEVLSPNL